jgi:hypothetical protein
LKSVHIFGGDVSVLDFLPETEKLKVFFEMADPGGHLKRYLEKQKVMTSLKFSSMGINLLPFWEANIDFKLSDLELFICSDPSTRSQYSSDPIIKFVKSQAETLTRLKFTGIFIDLNALQILLESMKALECLEFSFAGFSQTPRFVAKNFSCLKLRKLNLESVFHFPLFNKLPNLEELEVNQTLSQSDLLLKSAQKCQNVKKLVVSSFGNHPSNASFPKLIDLEIKCELSDQHIDNFLLNQKSLEKLKLDAEVDETLLRKILEKLTNLKHLDVRLSKANVEREAEYQRNCDANKEILRNIWPLLGNLKILAINGDGLDKYAIYQEFPTLPELTIINTE